MENTFSWKTADGIDIYGIDWPVDQAKAVVCIIHGLGEHIHRYEHAVSYFHKNKIAVIGYDRRGHGRSGGKKGHTISYDAFLDEIEYLEKEAKNRYPELAVFLYGHSMGGNLLLNYVLNRKPIVNGIISTGAHISLAFEPSSVTLALGRLMKRIYPGFTQPNGLDVTQISRDSNVVEVYKNDPYVHNKLTAITGLSLLERADVLNNYSGDFPLPLLIMHGGADGITAPKGSENFAARVNGDITLKIWDDFYHEIHNEPEQDQVFAEMTLWIQQHI